MGFKDLSLEDYYNNEEYDLIDQFYNPIIKETKIYKRASGFFSSSSFWSFIEGLKIFLENEESKIYLLISPEISEEDAEAILLGSKLKEEILENFLEIKLLERDKFENQFNLLVWLIYTEKLEIKFVVKKDMNKSGIFHDKVAIMEDYEGEKIGFHGSLNESKNGLINNFESIELFKSWNEIDSKRINRNEEVFKNIWNNKLYGWESINFPENIKKKIIDLKRPLEELRKIKIPQKYKLRDYQNEAIESWVKNRFNGILEMATGSGKTLTAIFAMIKLINIMKNKRYPCGIVILVPYKNLLEQWCEELEEFNIRPIKCYDNRNLWKYKLDMSIINFNKYKDKDLFIIATNATYITEEFQRNLSNIERDYIFCVDEMHHLTAPKIIKLLPENTNFRLGLTATLENDYELETLETVKKYFSGIVFKFGLKDAIANNCLTQYYYYPIFTELTREELEEYKNITRRIMSVRKDSPEETKKILMLKRKKIIFNAKNKIEKFNEIVKVIGEHKRTLVYCGDKIENENKFINNINKIISDNGYLTSTYTSETKNIERKRILNEFRAGRIEVLTAIRCLDEGVNIREIDCAIVLSSNSDSKQFIQRRGRILRKAKGKEFAYIYDFIVVPTLDHREIEAMKFEEKKLQLKIFLNEMKRVKEFAELSNNKLDVLLEITKILKLYQ